MCNGQPQVDGGKTFLEPYKEHICAKIHQVVYSKFKPNWARPTISLLK